MIGETFWKTFLAALFFFLVAIQFSFAQDAVSGVKVPDGFEIIKVAGDDLATNVFCMAVSPNGEAFVSGPGYIKALVDSDGDGVFDSTRVFSNAPRSGAQGICFDGNDLLCTGDGALLRFADSDGDGVSDGAPTEIFKIKTGGEHDAHAIRKGADGWWYVLAGNGVPILDEYFDSPLSPVKNPRAGFLMRISPDWKQKQIYCHGFRNAYDFDFNSLGEVFVYDSDGERDISLPWYRPTRVFRMRPGDDAGWVSQSWKRPGYFFDMPPVIGSLGRGSPTGVKVGNSKQFPRSYKDAIFVADWTFGRVVAFRRDAEGKYDSGTDFAIANGQFGFAVTDLDFTPDGSLLISAGGRGTEGAIYRVRFKGQRNDVAKRELTETEEFIRLSKSKRHSIQDLIGALESDDSRAREAGLEVLVGDSTIWDGSNGSSVEQMKLARALNKTLKLSKPRETILFCRFMPYPITKTQQGISTDLRRVIFDGVPASDLPIRGSIDLISNVKWDEAKGKTNLNSNMLVEQIRCLKRGLGDPLFIARLGQLTLRDCGAKGVDPMFFGYTSSIDSIRPTDGSLAPSAARKLSNELAMALQRNGKDLKPGDATMMEIGRFAAMLGARSNELQLEVAKQLTDESSAAVVDIHWLNCLARLIIPEYTEKDKGFEGLKEWNVPITPEVESIIAKALVGVGKKIERDGLNIDRNFYPRMKSLVRILFAHSKPSLARSVATQLVGDESEIYLLESIPGGAPEAKHIAMARFAERIEKDPKSVTSSLLNVLAKDKSGQYLSLIRRFAGRYELRGIVIGAVAQKPDEMDREMFIQGLKSYDLTTIKNSAIGLRRLFDKTRGNELVGAFLASSRLGWDKPSISVRDQLMMLIERHAGEAGQSFGYQPKKNKLNQSDVLKDWGEWIAKEHPTEYQAAFKNDGTANVLKRLEKIDWSKGDRTRGKLVYQKLQCAQCHDGGSRLGPRLEGVSKRFGRDDLFNAIVSPNLQVPNRYRARVIETVDGDLYRGSMVYASVDGITLQLVSGSTVRINKDDIEAETLSPKSLMPEGLLNESSNGEWADLFEYLKSR